MDNNLKDKLKTPKFWLAVTGAVVLFLQTIGIKIDAPLVNEAVSALCGLLVVLGVLSKPKASKATDGETDAASAQAQLKDDETDDKLDLSKNCADTNKQQSEGECEAEIENSENETKAKAG